MSRRSFSVLWICFENLGNNFINILTAYKVIYRQFSNIRRTSLGNKIVDHSDVVGASPVGAAPTTSSISTWHLATLDWAKTTARRD